MRSTRKTTLLILAACLCTAAFLPAAGASAAPVPALALTVTPMPSNFTPGASPSPQYLVVATNVGPAPTSGVTVVKATLPAGITPTAVSPIDSDPAGKATCELQAQEAKCETSDPLGTGRLLLAQVTVAVSPSAAEGTYLTKAAASAPNAAEVKTEFPTEVKASPLAFDFLPGFLAPATDEEGEAAVLSGSHPYQQTVAFGFPTKNPGGVMTNDGHPRDFSIELPRGMAGDPAASPVLCTELELTLSRCPDASQVGISNVTTSFGQAGASGITANGISDDNLYAMVPPPGAVAALGTNVAGAGIFAHALIGVRSDSDYGVEATVPDVLALGTQPIFSLQTQVWGDPTGETHDHVRGQCLGEAKTPPCSVSPRGETALLTMPAECPGKPLPYEVHADTWEEPSPPAAEHKARYESADLTGKATHLEGCGDEEVAFKPTIEAHSTTNVSDSPSGLDFTLHQPQDMKLGSRSPSPLRDAAIRFPAGMTVNPAQAAGLGACTEAEVGFEEEVAGGRLDFSKQPQSCPEAAKIGTLEVTSPALVARNEHHEVEKDIEENPVLEPLHGSVYLAQPFANPFESLVAVYLVVEDAKTGIVAKLAGKGELDPQTGRITTYVKESPELPLEDFKVHIFGGPRGAFITPPTCGKHITESDLTPWSAPEGEDAFPQSSFETSHAPDGGGCPATEAQMPRAFKLSAGTENPTAGKYTPLIFKLSRQDGSQRLSKIESTMPKGLIAKLAGVGICSEADIAKARSREAPDKGAIEQADPSCPAASQLGVVIAGAGAGTEPFYTRGHAYLAGPYGGAPLSIVAIVPALAGPFDLGAVVTRIAVFLDPVTAQVRAVSDPLPSVLHGVPIDLRSVALRADRPGFSLNPTSCDEKAFGGQAISTLGQVAPLFQRFQVGGCQALPYGPKMSVRLFGAIHRGGHPRLKAVFTAKPGEANTAAISFTFPRSEFIDQAHFRTICTRVQFAAGQCPAGSVYGHVRVISPLVDYVLEGPAYLRSSSHKLPDLVVALHGPPSQPIELDAAGRVDSVNGGLRVRFQEVPDAPFSKLVFSAQGAKKGLFQNSTNICKGIHRATLKLDAQSGKVSDTQPKLVAQCSKGSKKRAKSLHRK